VPFDSFVVAIDAFPLASMPVPNVIVPFLKVTVPVGVPDVEEFTVAVNVTLWPTPEGLTDDTTDVEVAAFFTTSVNTGDTLER
jgi:hypothetical protein